MAESIFLGMCKSETDDKNNTLDINFKTAYALYKCVNNSSAESLLSVDETPRLSSNGSRDRHESVQYSTEIILTGLEGPDATELDRFINRKLSKGTVHCSAASISAIDLSLGEAEPQLYLCYYNLLELNGSLSNADLTPLSLDTQTGATCAQSDDKENILVCLVAPANSQLDLFKPDLDHFSNQLLGKLDFGSCDIISAKPYLECWFESATSYIARCVKKFGPDVKYLIHVSLSDAGLDLQCSDDNLKRCIKRFVEVCSLSELLSIDMSGEKFPERSSSENKSHDLLVDLDSAVQPMHKVKANVGLKVDQDDYTFENQDCTKYCDDWSAALENCDSNNHPQLRHVIENYKLKVIQDMNTLNRLLKQAEFDYYAMYRCYMFLEQCGNSSILLRHADHQLYKSNQPETEQILQVLREHLERCRPSTIR